MPFKCFKEEEKPFKYFEIFHIFILGKTKANNKEGNCRINVLGVEEKSRIITGSVKS